ncbi:hypothetical protein JTB14_020814 [Gonioctena quinquepunctata]|nr:hypothetical protein JTB14_020814 [Gonioctena quinquepunctata]
MVSIDGSWIQVFPDTINMSSKSTYFENISRVVQKGLKNNNKTKENMEQDIKILVNWIESQPHLPEIPDNNTIMNFLMINKFSIENTKPKLDLYYTMRSLFPDFFENKHPLSPNMQKLMDKLYYFPLPKATEEGYRVTIFYIRDDVPDCFSVNEFFAHTNNINDIRLQEDCHLGEIYIYDLKNLKIGTISQVTPTIVRNASIISQKVFNNNIQQIHLVNYPSFMEPLLTVSKQIISSEVARKIFLHRDAITIADIISPKILPKDFGGDEPSLEEFNEIWRKKFLEYKERFDVLEKMRVNEKLRPTPLINDDVLGYHGSFKKLDVD